MSKHKAVPKSDINIEELINDAVQKAIQVGRIQNDVAVKDIFKSTEKRLYALPTLIKKVESDKGWVISLRMEGAPERSSSIVRFSASGVRLSGDEIIETLIMDAQAKIAADEYEIATMQKALDIIGDDPYYDIINLKYFNGHTDDEIGDELNCDPRTIRRNKNRLIQNMAIFLYGVRAVA